MMGLGMPELFVIFLIILVVFGAGKIPTIARDMGKGIREFKRAMRTEDDEIEPSAAETAVKAVKKKAVKKAVAKIAK